MSAYVTATKRIRHSDVCFMDLFAGSGKDRSRETGEIVDGSPLLAMDLYPGFRKFIFVDIDPNNTRQLWEFIFERKLADISRVIAGDCNKVIDQALQSVPKAGATFCFIDPAGVDVEWITIRRIARHKPPNQRKIELFILFPYDMALVRMLVREGTPGEAWGPQVERKITLAMPDDMRWRRVHKDRNDGVIDPPEARRRFVYLYWMGLRKLGYRYVVRPKLLRSPRGNPLYFLFFASDHPAGERIMSHVLQKPRGFEQLSMPILEDPWRFEEGEEWY